MENSKTLIPAICPQCGANIQLDKKLEIGYCAYCGTKIIIKDIVTKVKILDNPTLENYIKIADRAYDDQDYEKALDNYRKALEIEPDDYKVIYREGICTAKISNLEKFNIDKAVSGCKHSFEIMNELGIEKIEVANTAVLAAMDLYLLSISYYKTAMEHFIEFCRVFNSVDDLWNRLLKIRVALNYIIKILLSENVIEICPSDNNGNSSEELKMKAMKQLLTIDIELCADRKEYNTYGNPCGVKRIDNSIRKEITDEYDSIVAFIKKTDKKYKPERINRFNMYVL